LPEEKAALSMLQNILMFPISLGLFNFSLVSTIQLLTWQKEVCSMLSSKKENARWSG